MTVKRETYVSLHRCRGGKREKKIKRDDPRNCGRRRRTCVGRACLFCIFITRRGVEKYELRDKGETMRHRRDEAGTSDRSFRRLQCDVTLSMEFIYFFFARARG